MTAIDAPDGPVPRGGLAVVTGTGFVASHLIRRLRAAGTEVVVVTRQAGDFGDRTISCPLTELTSQVWDEAGVQQIGTLYHLAAATPKNGAQANNVDGAYEGNLLGTRALLQSVSGLIGRIVFTSTLDVYGSTGGAAMDEDTPARPESLYGAAKLFCESLVRVWARAEGCEHAVIRLGHVYGPGEDKYRKLVPETIRRLLADQAPVVYGDGRARADLLHVDDSVEALHRAGQLGRTVPDPLNVVGPSVSVAEIIDALVRATDYEGVVEYLTDRPNPPSIEFDDRKMRESLGDWRRVELEAGLRGEVEHMHSLIGGQR